MPTSKRNPVLCMVAAGAVAAGTLYGQQTQLTLLTGGAAHESPNGSASSIIQVKAGRITSDEPLVSAASGVFSIYSDAQGHIGVSYPNDSPKQLVVLNQQDPSMKRSVAIPGIVMADGGRSTVVLTLPTKEEGVLFPLAAPADNEPHPSAAFLEFSPQPGASRVFRRGQFTLAHFSFAGTAGGAQADFEPIGVVRKGKILLQFPGEELSVAELPDDLALRNEGEQVGVVASNETYLLISFPQTASELQAGTASGEDTRTIYVMNRVSRHWSHIEVPGNTAPVRLFGAWVAAEKESFKGTPQDNPGRDEEDESVAHDYESGVGATMSVPGELILLNLESGQMRKMHTGKEDSEILSVSSDRVLLRVNTVIYETKTTAFNLANASKLIDNPVCAQVHWAWLR